ncbi:MAG: hypothetical protein KDC44_13290, partial [Phaeodactylibacter sp.]|nr:hypothetical protein [Phaeodactylibacter sp.]
MFQSYSNKMSLLILLLLCAAYGLPGQEVRTNEQGEKIIVYPDGSWKYFHGSGDSVDPFGGGQAAHLPNDEGLPALPEKDMYEQQELREQENALNYAEKVAGEAAQLELVYKNAKLRRVFMEEDLETLRLSSTTATPRIEALEAELEAARKWEWLTRQRSEKGKALSELAERLIYIKHRKRVKYYDQVNALEKDLEELLAANDLEEIYRDETRTENLEVNEPAYYSGEITRQGTDCSLAFDGIDEFTGKHRKEHEPQLFFTHTQEELRDYMQGRDHITCTGFMTAFSGGLVYLTLEFAIASQNAKVAFGGLSKNAILSIRMMDGESVRLLNLKADN